MDANGRRFKATEKNEENKEDFPPRINADGRRLKELTVSI